MIGFGNCTSWIGAAGGDANLRNDSLERFGFNRGSRLGGAHGAGHREWLHFCVHDGSAILLANFSASATSTADAAEEVLVPRLTVIACDAERWMASSESYANEPCSGLVGGAFGARMGESHVALARGDVRLRIRSQRADVEADLVLTPCAAAAPSHNVVVPGSPPLNWVVVPRLLATGTMRLGQRECLVDRAPAYHDHNWGAFRWGADFRWEWGYALPTDPETPWAVVAVRLTNRARTVVLEQGVLVWRGGELVRTFRSDEVQYRTRGLLGLAPAARVPGPLALLRPGRATDTPRQATFHAGRGDDWIDVAFVPNAVAQILVPNDVGNRVTAIHEARSKIDVRGQILGTDVRFETTGFLELLGS